MDMDQRNRIAQWVFDTRQILTRFHIWLDDVEEHYSGDDPPDGLSFVGGQLERAFIMSAAVTALGTRLFGRYGEAKGQDRVGINRVKKDADAISAYALSEALWHLTRYLPENHALMVSLGEGLMPKGGETPEMGSNPLLGFGRIYARPQVARCLDRKVRRMINEPGYEWEDFWKEIQEAGITVWGAAIDTLENTTRFAKGAETGPLTVLHLFDQPLRIARPYEGYFGNLVLPRSVVNTAADHSVLLDFLTPRRKVMEMIRATYPGLRSEHVHVWTLGGTPRKARISGIWQEWEQAGAHVVEDGWMLPSGMKAFTDSGTYAATFQVGTFQDEQGELHLFLCDGYAASAEAIQAASLDPILGLKTSMCLFSSLFQVPWERERLVMHLSPEAEDFPERLAAVLERPLTPQEVGQYRENLRNAAAAGMPLGRRTMGVDDFFPNKQWRVLALMGFMLPDPYTGLPGVEPVEGGRPNSFKVTVRAATLRGTLDVTLTLRLQETLEESRLVFSPLLDRFYQGLDYRNRAVKISDSGRIRQELQTLASEALEYMPDEGIRIHFELLDDAVLSGDKKQLISEVLRWYKEHHPFWFRWLDIA